MVRKGGVHSQFGGWPIRRNRDGSVQRFVDGRWVAMPAEWARSARRAPSGRPPDYVVKRGDL